ncbi:MAG: hypothetical protein JO177_02275 [Candidatus Eremiobacteraeota bacterium]|nr:hypothetical protein [Candidatus Eremiobacteraeota bacterium]
MTNKRRLRTLFVLGAMLLGASSLAPMSRALGYGAGTFALEVDPGPYVGGTTIPIKTRGLSGDAPIFSVIGPGEIQQSTYVAPLVRQRSSVTLIAATLQAFALQNLQLVPPPDAHAHLIAVATYYSGIVLHSARDFHIAGIVPIDGAAGDVASAVNGDLYVPATDSTMLYDVSRTPWQVNRIRNVPFGNEAAVDPSDGAVFVSNRDVEGKGALTRIRNGTVDRVITGTTAEGLALDAPRHLIYVGNINDDSIAEVDTRTLHIVRRIASVPRTFGMALDGSHHRLFVVSNQNVGMAGGGYVATLDLISAKVVRRSARFPFPIGIAFDPRRNVLFVTDEDAAEIYVLDAHTLHERRSPLHACAVPWRPHLDLVSRRLYVPCARANRVVVFDADRYRPITGSPFLTGRYPLSVATSG